MVSGYSVEDAPYSTLYNINTSKINTNLKFGNLPVGSNYQYVITATNSIGTRFEQSYIFNIVNSSDVRWYQFDVNGWLDGGDSGDISGYGMFDITIGGEKHEGVVDWFDYYPEGTTYKIENIRPSGTHNYIGVYAGELEGTINSDKNIKLNFRTNNLFSEYDASYGDDFFAYLKCSNGLYVMEQGDANVTADPGGRGINYVWHFVKTSDNYYKITSAKTGKALTYKAIGASDSINSNIANIQLNDWNGSNAQLWAVHIVNGKFALSNKESQLLMDAGLVISDRYNNVYMLHDIGPGGNQLFELEALTLTIIYNSNGATSIKVAGDASSENWLSNNPRIYSYTENLPDGLWDGDNQGWLYLEKTGYTMESKSWNTKADGTGISIDWYQAFSSGNDLAKALGVDLSTGSKTVTLYAEWQPLERYQFDINGWIDGRDNGDISGYGTFDITIGGEKHKGVIDWFDYYPEGTTYKIENIRPSGTHNYIGVYAGELEGTINSDKNIKLNFRTNNLFSEYDASYGDDFFAYLKCSNGLYVMEQGDANVTADPGGRGINYVWHFVKTSDNYYKITSAKTGKALTYKAIGASDSINSNIANIQLNDWNGSNAQLWAVHIVNGKFALSNKESQLLMDAGLVISDRYNNVYMLHDIGPGGNQLFELEALTLTIIYNSNGATSIKVAGDASSENWLSNNPRIYSYTENLPDGLWDGDNQGWLYLEKTGYTMESKSWNTKADGTGISIDWYQSFDSGNDLAKALGVDLSTGSKTVTLYAEWQPFNLTVIYNSNGGSGAPAAQTKTQGAALTLSSTKPTRDGYTFLGWAESSTATTAQYQPGGSFTKDANTTLYAVWQLNTYTVTYNAGGGTGAPAAQTKAHGTALTLSSTKPTRDGYTFLGWAESSTATTAQYQPGGSFTKDADATLYAVWQEIREDTLNLQVEHVGGILKEGAQLRVPITATQNPGYVLGSIYITWDSEALELVDVEYNDLLAPKNQSSAITNSGRYILDFGNELSLSDYTGTGVFFTLVFQVTGKAEEKQYPIGIGLLGGFSNSELTSVEAQLSGGSVTLEEAKYIPGDANGDGQVNNTDRMILVRYLAGWDGYAERIAEMDAVDLNNDGKVNNTDRMILVRYLAGWDGYAKYFE